MRKINSDELISLGVSSKITNLFNAHNIAIVSYIDAYRAKLFNYSEWHQCSENTLATYFPHVDIVAVNFTKMHDIVEIEHVLLHEFAHATGRSTRENREGIIEHELRMSMPYYEACKIFNTREFYYRHKMEEILADITSFELAKKLELNDLRSRSKNARLYIDRQLRDIMATQCIVVEQDTFVNIMILRGRELANKYVTE